MRCCHVYTTRAKEKSLPVHSLTYVQGEWSSDTLPDDTSPGRKKAFCNQVCKTQIACLRTSCMEAANGCKPEDATLLVGKLSNMWRGVLGAHDNYGPTSQVWMISRFHSPVREICGRYGVRGIHPHPIEICPAVTRCGILCSARWAALQPISRALSRAKSNFGNVMPGGLHCQHCVIAHNLHGNDSDNAHYHDIMFRINVLTYKTTRYN